VLPPAIVLSVSRSIAKERSITIGRVEATKNFTNWRVRVAWGSGIIEEGERSMGSVAVA
jgi:hypothetical protein